MQAQNRKCRILLVLSAFRLLGFLRSHTPKAIVLVRNINHPDICRTIVNTCIPSLLYSLLPLSYHALSAGTSENAPNRDGSLIRGKGQRYLRLWQTDC